ncbi:reverse transcriptase domain-containing protein [Tanacetum coccineum]
MSTSRTTVLVQMSEIRELHADDHRLQAYTDIDSDAVIIGTGDHTTGTGDSTTGIGYRTTGIARTRWRSKQPRSPKRLVPVPRIKIMIMARSILDKAFPASKGLDFNVISNGYVFSWIEENGTKTSHKAMIDQGVTAALAARNVNRMEMTATTRERELALLFVYEVSWESDKIARLHQSVCGGQSREQTQTPTVVTVHSFSTTLDPSILFDTGADRVLLSTAI